jgi:ankyrin repeat protein
MRCLTSCFIFMSLVTAVPSSSQGPVEISEIELYEHRTPPVQMIHSDKTINRFDQRSVGVEVIVDINGQVESARAISGPEAFYRRAEMLEGKRRFRPFLRNSGSVRATFSDYVSILPPEEWIEPKVPFREIADMNSLRMRLKRTPGWGGPEYTVDVRGDGQVDFDGKGVLVTGHHRSLLSKQRMQELVAAFRRANFFSLKNEYVYPVTDTPTYITSIHFDGYEKSVRDHAGSEAGMPDTLGDLENEIDRIAGTEKWVEGNSETAAALITEKWDFSADTEENRAVFANIVAHGPDDVIQLFQRLRAPALSMTKEGESALANAAAKGDVDLVKQMLNSKTEPTPALLSCTLAAAAGSGNLELVRFLFETGARVNNEPCGRYDHATVLMKASTSGKVEIVKEILRHSPDLEARNQNGFTALSYYLQRTGSQHADVTPIVSMLLSAGANPNSQDEMRETPLFHACSNGHTKVIGLLAKAGADVNVKNRYGQTVLMSCFGNEAVKAVIDAGADLMMKNQFGRTAAQEARQMGANDKADLLESASANRGQPIK